MKAALAYHHAGAFSEAVQAYQQHLQHCPEDAPAWSNLGAALRRLEQPGAAVVAFRRALGYQPDNVITLSGLGNALKDLDRFDEAIAVHRQALRLAPGSVNLLFNLAIALRLAHRYTEAMQYLSEALQKEPARPALRLEAGLVALALGDYARGWPLFEARWQTGELALKLPDIPLWQGEPLMGKKLLLLSEQGFGDSLLASRFVPMLKSMGAHVSLSCKPALRRVLQHCGADQFLGPALDPDSLAGFDGCVPMMSLPGLLGIRPHNIPPPAQLHVPDAARQKFAPLRSLRTHLKVGIVWSGSITFANNVRRSTTLSRFLSLAEIEGVRLYSLQKGPCRQALDDTGAGAVVEDLSRHCQDFADTAAAVEALDLVVMTDSSVAHLAASLGKPVWNLLDYCPYWLYELHADHSPWYPGMRFFRQPTPGNWDAVFASVRSALEHLARDRAVRG
jgi:hypothetical protein